jgi:hypothetical protein
VPQRTATPAVAGAAIHGRSRQVITYTFVLILSGENHKINFPMTHEVHTKSLDFENLTSFKL